MGMKCFGDNLQKCSPSPSHSNTFSKFSHAFESQEQSEGFCEAIWHPSPSLCARHARVYRMKDHWCVEALDGSTWLNGQRLQPGWGHAIPESWLEWSEWFMTPGFQKFHVERWPLTHETIHDSYPEPHQNHPKKVWNITNHTFSIQLVPQGPNKKPAVFLFEKKTPKSLKQLNSLRLFTPKDFRFFGLGRKQQIDTK